VEPLPRLSLRYSLVKSHSFDDNSVNVGWRNSKIDKDTRSNFKVAIKKGKVKNGDCFSIGKYPF